MTATPDGPTVTPPPAPTEAASPPPPEETAPLPTPGVQEDLYMTAEDFECILNGDVKVRHYYLSNELGHLEEAQTVANSPEGGDFPVGTIIQLIPTEAMVKRKVGWSPSTGDWEYFLLEVSAAGTTILQRGDSELGPTGVTNSLGTCQSCHSMAEPQWDFVCESGHGCAPLPFTDSQIETIQGRDPRCP